MSEFRIRRHYSPEIQGIFYKIRTNYTRTRQNDYLYSRDVVGRPNDSNQLYLYSRVASGAIANGRSDSSGDPKWIYTACPMPITDSGASRPEFIDPDLLLNRVLASSGPSAPVVNLPVVLAELKDVPKMLKHAGDTLHGLTSKGVSFLTPREIASANLALEFGWKPLVSDFLKIADLSKRMDQHHKNLEKASQSGGLRRRVNLGETNVTSSKRELIDTTGVQYNPTTTRSVSTRQWATIHWRPLVPNSQVLPRSSPEYLKMVTGFNPRNIPLATWKLMPWSWMADWFLDLSNQIQAANNMIDYVPRDCCIMTELKATAHMKAQTYRFADGSTIYITPGSIEQSWKLRTPYVVPSPSFTLKLPYMDDFKTRILASLTVLKGRP